MTIKAKILSLVAAFACLATIITVLGLNTMADYQRTIAHYTTASYDAFRGERLNRYVLATTLEMRGIYMAKTEEPAKAAAAKLDMRASQLEAFLKAWKASLTPNEVPEFASVERECLSFTYSGHYIAMLTLTQSKQAAADFGNHENFRVYREQMQGRIDTMVSGIQNHLQQSQDDLTRFETLRVRQFLLIAVSGILLLVAASIWIAIDSIVVPLRKISQSIVRISERAYDTPVPISMRDSEVGQLWNALAILKARAITADQLAHEKLEQEHKLRELVLD